MQAAQLQLVAPGKQICSSHNQKTVTVIVRGGICISRPEQRGQAHAPHGPHGVPYAETDVAVANKSPAQQCDTVEDEAQDPVGSTQHAAGGLSETAGHSEEATSLRAIEEGPGEGAESSSSVLDRPEIPGAPAAADSKTGNPHPGVCPVHVMDARGCIFGLAAALHLMPSAEPQGFTATAQTDVETYSIPVQVVQVCVLASRTDVSSLLAKACSVLPCQAGAI